MSDTTLPLPEPVSSKAKTTNSLSYTSIGEMLFILVACGAFAHYVQFDLSGAFLKAKEQAHALNLTYLRYVLITFACISFSLYFHMYQSYRVFLSRLIQHKARIAHKDTKAIQSFLVAIDQEIAIKSNKIYFSRRKTLLPQYTRPIHKIDLTAIICLSFFVAAPLFNLMVLINPLFWGIKLILSFCIFLGLFVYNSTIPLEVTTLVNDIRKQIASYVKNSQSPAVKYCEYNQTNSRKFKVPDVLCGSVVAIPQNIVWQIATVLLITASLLTFLFYA